MLACKVATTVTDVSNAVMLLLISGAGPDGVMRQIALCKQPAVLRRSALSRIEKARARTLKMTIVIGKINHMFALSK